MRCRDVLDFSDCHVSALARFVFSIPIYDCLVIDTGLKRISNLHPVSGTLKVLNLCDQVSAYLTYLDFLC